jgi:hypothetical protein
VEPVEEKKRSFPRHFESHPFSSFFKESLIAEHWTKLLRPFIAGNPASQKLESSAVSTGEDDSPFMFELFGCSLVGAASVDHRSWDRVQI